MTEWDDGYNEACKDVRKALSEMDLQGIVEMLEMSEYMPHGIMEEN